MEEVGCRRLVVSVQLQTRLFPVLSRYEIRRKRKVILRRYNLQEAAFQVNRRVKMGSTVSYLTLARCPETGGSTIRHFSNDSSLNNLNLKK
jgi:hypothetical protein